MALFVQFMDKLQTSKYIKTTTDEKLSIGGFI